MKLGNIDFVATANIRGCINGIKRTTIDDLAKQALKTKSLPAPIKVKDAGFDCETRQQHYKAVDEPKNNLLYAVALEVRKRDPKIGEISPVELVNETLTDN
jgi:hypothetical protein